MRHDTVKELVVLRVHDTIRESTIVSIQTNTEGDTLKQSIITDRVKVRNHDQSTIRCEARITEQTEKELKKDSIAEQEKMMTSSTPNNLLTPKDEPRDTLRWLFAVLCAATVFIITLRVCIRKAS